MRKSLVCLVLRHRWIHSYDDANQQRRRECRRCGVNEVHLSDMDFNPNHIDPLGPGLGLGR